MTTRNAQRKAVLSKLHEVQRLVTVIQNLDAQDPERALAVVRWMVESEEAATLAASATGLLSVQELADLEAAINAISTDETKRWEKKRIEMEIARLWGDPNKEGSVQSENFEKGLIHGYPFRHAYEDLYPGKWRQSAGLQRFDPYLSPIAA